MGWFVWVRDTSEAAFCPIAGYDDYRSQPMARVRLWLEPASAILLSKGRSKLRQTGFVSGIGVP